MRAGAGAASGSGSAFFYSFDLGLVHYVAINTELYIYQKEARHSSPVVGAHPRAIALSLSPSHALHSIATPQTAASQAPVSREQQLAWLEADLAAADANRANVPWIVVYGHKGWYMAYFRTPQASFYQVDFSDFAALFDTHHVDLYLCGHNHIYQRCRRLRVPGKKRELWADGRADTDHPARTRHRSQLETPTVAAPTAGSCLSRRPSSPLRSSRRRPGTWTRTARPGPRIAWSTRTRSTQRTSSSGRPATG